MSATDASVAASTEHAVPPHPGQSGDSVVPSHYVYQHLLMTDQMPSPLDTCLPREGPVYVFGYWPDGVSFQNLSF